MADDSIEVSEPGICSYVLNKRLLCCSWSLSSHACMNQYQINLTITVMINKHIDMQTHTCTYRETFLSLTDGRERPTGFGTKEAWAQISTLLY